MSLQYTYNFELNRIEWIDLSYVLGETDTPDPRRGQPVEAVEHRLHRTALPTCPKCGSEVNHGWRSCKACGYRRRTLRQK